MPLNIEKAECAAKEEKFVSHEGVKKKVQKLAARQLHSGRNRHA
jgi:hypothetical protein